MYFSVFLIICYVVKKERKQFWQILKSNQFFWKQTIMAILLHIILRLILVSFSIDPIAKNTYGLIEEFKTSKIKFLAGACITAPFLEEFVFRYLIFEVFGKGKNNMLGFLLSSLISLVTFTFHHYQGENNIIELTVFICQYLAATLWFIYLYRKSQWTLAIPILFHSLTNLFVFINLLVKPDFIVL